MDWKNNATQGTSAQPRHCEERSDAAIHKMTRFEVNQRFLNRSQKEQTKHSLGGMVPRMEVVRWLESSFEPICPVCQSNQFYRWGYQAGSIRTPASTGVTDF